MKVLTSLFISYQEVIMLITSKGNWKNYYGYDARGIHEVVKVGGRFYLAKLVIGEWLLAIWSPLKDFTLVTD